MEFGRAFTFITKDEDWATKLGVGAALNLFGFYFGWLLLPLLLFPIVSGYQIAIIRNVLKGEEVPLPSWQNWGKLLSDGLKVLVGIIIYTLPVVLVAICGAVAIAAGSGGEGNGEEMFIVSVVVMSCLVIVLAFAILLIVPAITIQYAATGQVSGMFQLARVASITKDNLVDVILVILVRGVAGFALSLLAMIPVFGWIFIWPAGATWLSFATGHLYGQIGKKSGVKYAIKAIPDFNVK